jgi:hypothetical protein
MRKKAAFRGAHKLISVDKKGLLKINKLLLISGGTGSGGQNTLAEDGDEQKAIL